MARYTEPSCRLCRRANEKLFLKGTRCVTEKCAVSRREYAPGQHGQMQRRKMSNYASQLQEKQKAKRIYNLLERQFKNYFRKAEKSKGTTGEVLLQLLERRLDNVIYRALFSESRPHARQLVGHRFVKVNGRRVNIPSYFVKTGDEVSIAGPSDTLKAIKEMRKALDYRSVPDWLECSEENLTIKVKRLPTKSDIGMAIEESLIVELYSK